MIALNLKDNISYNILKVSGENTLFEFREIESCQPS